MEKLIEYAIEHRDEVEDLAEAQKGKTAEEIAAEQAELMGGASTVAELEAKLTRATPSPLRAMSRPARRRGPRPRRSGSDVAATPLRRRPSSPTRRPWNPSRRWMSHRRRPTRAGPNIPPPPTDPSGPGKSAAAAAAAKVLTQEAVTEALGADVPPREAAERITFATWAIVTGKSPGGIFNELPAVDDETAAKIAERLSERAEGTITVEDVRAAKTIEQLATTVREFLEAGELEGFVRTLRAPKEGTNHVPVFVFHPAGGSTVVYEPLLRRLPADVPVYGLERVEGSIEERAAEYVPKLMELGGKGPYILAGWSLGGALAYACAVGLKRNGATSASSG